MIKWTHYRNKRQSGTVMVLSLVILSILTLTAVVGMKTSITDEKTAGNLRDRELAHQAAESALRQARTMVSGWTDATAMDGTNGLLYFRDDEPDYYNPTTWKTAGAYQSGNVMANGQLATEPKFVIRFSHSENWCASAALGSLSEIQGNSETCASDVYLITAQGTGLSPNTSISLQEYFGRPQF